MAPTSTAGYSNTPLARKLGIKAGSLVCTNAAPQEYGTWIEPLPEGVRLAARFSANADIVHLFVSRRARLSSQLQRCRERLRPDAAVWVSWPKKASRVPSEVTEDTIRTVALPLGFVDIKVCAVSDVWSGLKLVVRKELR